MMIKNTRNDKHEPTVIDQRVIDLNKNNIMETKKNYIIPCIEIIFLDNEISLALESNPPAGPSETLNSIQCPFKQETGLV